MKIGIPKERKKDEHRVALMPHQVHELTRQGHKIFVESSAGIEAGFVDNNYIDAGAEIVGQEDVYEAGDLILKVKCPLPEESHFYGRGKTLFAYLHFDENIPPEIIRQIVDTGVVGIAYEWVQEGSIFPLLQPMSELTGVLFASRATELLMAHKGKLPGKYFANQQPARAMVIGAGHIGSNAIRYLLKNGVRTTIVDKHPETLENRVCRYIEKKEWKKWLADIEIIHFKQDEPEQGVDAIRQKLPETDIVICSAVRRPDFPKDKCEFLIDREGVKSMEPKSVICDATACDRDYIETCVSSSSLTEIECIEGIIHYACDHIPSYVPQTSTHLLTTATFPYICLLANGVKQAIKRNEALRKAVMCYEGEFTHKKSADKKNLPFKDINQILGEPLSK